MSTKYYRYQSIFTLGTRDSLPMTHPNKIRVTWYTLLFAFHDWNIIFDNRVMDRIRIFKWLDPIFSQKIQWIFFFFPFILNEFTTVYAFESLTFKIIYLHVVDYNTTVKWFTKNKMLSNANQYQSSSKPADEIHSTKLHIIKFSKNFTFQ